MRLLKLWMTHKRKWLSFGLIKEIVVSVFLFVLVGNLFFYSQLLTFVHKCLFFVLKVYFACEDSR